MVNHEGVTGWASIRRELLFCVPPVVDVVPSVIEPSFGVGRIIYAVLEHSFMIRKGDEMRNWLAIPPSIAPISCSVLPLSGNEQFSPFVKKICKYQRLWAIFRRVALMGAGLIVHSSLYSEMDTPEIRTARTCIFHRPIASISHYDIDLAMVRQFPKVEQHSTI